jgi:hypothetical protein
MTTLVHTAPVSFTPAAGIRDIDAGSAVGRIGIWLRKIDAGAALARTGKRSFIDCWALLAGSSCSHLSSSCWRQL